MEFYFESIATAMILRDPQPEMQDYVDMDNQYQLAKPTALELAMYFVMKMRKILVEVL